MKFAQRFPKKMIRGGLRANANRFTPAIGNDFLIIFADYCITA